MSLSHLIGVLLIGLMVNKLPGFAGAEFALATWKSLIFIYKKVG
jgi:uncharacterized membrane protein